jgi:acyl-CoA thioester hydrolase
MQDPQVPPSSALRFRARLHTRWSDEDNQGVLNNAVILTLLEEARHAYFGRLGLLEANRFPFLLARCNVRFVAPGRGGVDVEVELATLELGTSSFRQAYRVRAVEGSSVWAEAEALLVCYDARTGKSAPMAPEFRSAIVAFEGLG